MKIKIIKFLAAFLAITAIVIGIITSLIAFYLIAAICACIYIILWQYKRITIKKKKLQEVPDTRENVEPYVPNQEYYRFQGTFSGINGKLTFTTELGSFTIPSKGKRYLYTCSVHHLLDYQKSNGDKGELIVEWHLTQMPNAKGIRKSLDSEYVAEGMKPQTNFFAVEWEKKYQGIHAFSVKIHEKTPITKKEE